MNFADSFAITAIEPAVSSVKSNCDNNSDRKAENPNTERCRPDSFIAITAPST